MDGTVSTDRKPPFPQTMVVPVVVLEPVMVLHQVALNPDLLNTAIRSEFSSTLVPDNVLSDGSPCQTTSRALQSWVAVPSYCGHHDATPTTALKRERLGLANVLRGPRPRLGEVPRPSPRETFTFS